MVCTFEYLHTDADFIRKSDLARLDTMGCHLLRYFDFSSGVNRHTPNSYGQGNLKKMASFQVCFSNSS